MDELDLKTKKEVTLAWNKLLWIQNDLFARHYVVDEDTGKPPRGVWRNSPGRRTALVAGVRWIWLWAMCLVSHIGLFSKPSDRGQPEVERELKTGPELVMRLRDRFRGIFNLENTKPSSPAAPDTSNIK